MSRICFVIAGLLLATTASAAEPSKLQVFILAGQSNMEGQGVVDLNDPKYYNGGKGILNTVMKNPKHAHLYQHLKNKDGNWVIRDDVWVRFQKREVLERTGGRIGKTDLKRGGLTIGFTGYDGKHHIGPELQFGHVIGDALEAQVLLIKTAWGGKSLFKDFRPPSSGGETGVYYKQMLAEVREGLDALQTDFPEYDGRGYEIAGFVWFQGWNDMFDDAARDQYEQNLANLIKDVRREFKVPNLPVVIGELGNGGPEAGENMIAIRSAEKAAANRPEFKGTVKFVSTTAFARPKEDSPNVGHGHHWFGNAESYFLIGDALGKAMVGLLK